MKNSSVITMQGSVWMEKGQLHKWFNKFLVTVSVVWHEKT